VDFDLRKQQLVDFILEESLLWIMDKSWKQWFKVKKALMMDLIFTNAQLLSPQDVTRWTGLDWCGLL